MVGRVKKYKAKRDYRVGGGGRGALMRVMEKLISHYWHRCGVLIN